MKPIRTIRPDIDEEFLVPLIISERERVQLLLGLSFIGGLMIALVVFIASLLI